MSRFSKVCCFFSVKQTTFHFNKVVLTGKGPASCADTVRHKDCHLLLNPDSKSLRCPACVQHRASLLVQAKRMLNTSRTAPSSHTNHRYLSRPELIDRLSKEHHERRLVAKQCQRLKTRIAEVSEKVGVSVNPEVHEGLKEIMVAQSDSILQSLPPNSFQVRTCMCLRMNEKVLYRRSCTCS